MTPLDPWNGAEQFDVLETKFDSVVSVVNAIGAGLDAGIAGDVPRKINGTDFNYEFVRVPTLATGSAARIKKRYEIGTWNMDADINSTIEHGLTSAQWKTISVLSIIIRNDSDDIYFTLQRVDPNGGVEEGGSLDYIDSTLINIRRITGGYFDNANFNNTSGGYNRGFLDIEYTP